MVSLIWKNSFLHSMCSILMPLSKRKLNVSDKEGFFFKKKKSVVLLYLHFQTMQDKLCCDDIMVLVMSA